MVPAGLGSRGLLWLGVSLKLSRRAGVSGSMSSRLSRSAGDDAARPTIGARKSSASPYKCTPLLYLSPSEQLGADLTRSIVSPTRRYLIYRVNLLSGSPLAGSPGLPIVIKLIEARGRW